MKLILLILLIIKPVMSWMNTNKNSEHIPQELENLLREIDIKSFPPKKKSIFDKLNKYLCCFSLINNKNIF